MTSLVGPQRGGYTGQTSSGSNSERGFGPGAFATWAHKAGVSEVTWGVGRGLWVTAAPKGWSWPACSSAKQGLASQPQV